MDRLVIKGGNRLEGEVRVEGSKNAALPIMAATILCTGESVIRGVPDLRDIRMMADLLRRLGARVTWEESTLSIDLPTLRL